MRHEYRVEKGLTRRNKGRKRSKKPPSPPVQQDGNTKNEWSPVQLNRYPREGESSAGKLISLQYKTGGGKK